MGLFNLFGDAARGGEAVLSGNVGKRRPAPMARSVRYRPGRGQVRGLAGGANLPDGG
jgi:hypothetical protein